VSRVESVLGIPERDCVNEYGMCELSSQFYAPGRSGVFRGPPWVRTRVVDPETGGFLVRGIGVLRHWDLANVDSVLAIQTEDAGESVESGFLLHGRAPGAT